MGCRAFLCVCDTESLSMLYVCTSLHTFLIKNFTLWSATVNAVHKSLLAGHKLVKARSLFELLQQVKDSSSCSHHLGTKLTYLALDLTSQEHNLFSSFCYCLRSQQQHRHVSTALHLLY